MLANLLDFRSKTMYGWSFELQEIAKLLLNSEYKEFEDDEIPEQVHHTTLITLTQSFASRIFGPPQMQQLIDNKISCYLDNTHTPQALPDIDIFQ